MQKNLPILQLLKELPQLNILLSFRWLISTLFFFLGLMKIIFLLKNGTNPYYEYVKALGLPTGFQYYGVIAVMVELFCGLALWKKELFKSGIALMSCLVSAGIFLGLYSLVFKFTSECGCGLLGDNEYGLLAQKMFILFALLILYNGRNKLFSNPENGGYH